MLTEAVDTLIRRQIKRLSRRGDGGARHGRGLNLPALGCFLQQHVVGGIQEGDGTALPVDPDLDLLRRQGEGLAALPLGQANALRSRDHREALELRQFHPGRVGDADDLRRPELNAKRAAIHAELGSVRL